MGFGLIELSSPAVYHALDWGVIKTKPARTVPERLHDIYGGLCGLLDEFHPDIVSVEQLFFFRNLTTVIPVAQARGVILLAAQERHIPIAEFTPLQVKQTITGSGKATKQEIQAMMKLELNLKDIPRPDDAADGLAIALTLIRHTDTLKTLTSQKPLLSTPPSGL